MSKVTVREAALLTGKSRQTINDATKDGTLSFSKNGRGHKVIDVAELDRVFDIINTPEEIKQSRTVQSDNPRTVNLSKLEKELSEMREEIISAHKRERDLLIDQIEILRRTVAEEREDKKTYIRLLEDKTGQGDKDTEKKVHELEQRLLAFVEKEEERERKRLQRRKEREIQHNEERNRGFWNNLFQKS